MNIGDLLPTFTLTGTDDRPHTVDVAGKPTLLIVTCNHCPHARAYVARIKELSEKYRDRVGVFAINPNDPVRYPEDSFENMKPMAGALGINGHYLFDETQEVARALGALRTPEVFLFNSDSKLAYHGSIDDNEHDANNVTHHYVDDAITAILAGKDPDVQETKPIGCSVKWRE